MSEKNLPDEKVDSEDDEDDDYCPTKNENNDESNSSDQSEDDEPVNESTEDKKQTSLNVTPYDESKTNDLWKNFTSSSNTKPSTTESPKITADPKPSTAETSKVTTDSKPINKIFEYAGEKVSVPISSTNSSSLKRPAAVSSSSTSNSILDRLGIGKKQKLSTLEKSRLDWNAHKESEALIEDLDSHRRSKDSYVEKTAFLQRSEIREHDHFLNSVKKK